MPPGLLVTQDLLAGELEAIRSEIYRLRAELKKNHQLVEEIVTDLRDAAEHPNRIDFQVMQMGPESLEHFREAIAMEQILRAARDDNLDVFTSSLTVAEVVHLGPKPPTDDEKELIERLLLSGRDGIQIVEASPFVAMKARDLVWADELYEGAMDRIHVAPALEVGASELLTIDGRLAKKFGKSTVAGCRLITPRDTKLLPNEYRTDDLFKGLDEPKEEGPEDTNREVPPEG